MKLFIKKISIPNGHVLELTIPRQTINDLSVLFRGDVKYILVPNDKGYVAQLNTVEKDAFIFGNAEKSEQFQEEDLEPPIL